MGSGECGHKIIDQDDDKNAPEESQSLVFWLILN